MSRALPDALPLVTLPRGSDLTRIHRLDSREPFFGPPPGNPSSHRFHDPLGEYRVCFLGEDATASFAETFLRRPPVRLITRAELAGRRLTTFVVARELRLVKLHGEGLAQIGTTAEVTSSPAPYAAPQALSRALWAHPTRPDGIHYRCRHDNERHAIALYDRAAGAIERRGSGELTADRPRLLAWRSRYGFDIA